MKDYTNSTIFANYFRGPEAVGGKIHFYEDSLIFKSHSLNIQTGETEIKYANITNIKKCNTLFVPNGIILTTNDGKTHRFVIYHRKRIIDFLISKTTIPQI